MIEKCFSQYLTKYKGSIFFKEMPEFCNGLSLRNMLSVEHRQEKQHLRQENRHGGHIRSIPCPEKILFT